jgi:hypothetical protein
MQVLDREQHRGVLAEAVEQPQQRLEQPRLCRGVAPRRCGAHPVAEPRQEGGELGAHGRGKLIEHGVPGARERAQHGHQRRVGQLAIAELDAVPAERASARGAGPRRELGKQARLAHARVARDERKPGLSRGCVGERAVELGELGRAAHEN